MVMVILTFIPLAAHISFMSSAASTMPYILMTLLGSPAAITLYLTSVMPFDSRNLPMAMTSCSKLPVSVGTCAATDIEASNGRAILTVIRATSK